MNNKVDDNNLDINLFADEQVASAVAHLLNDHAQHLNAVTLKRLNTGRALAVSQLAARQTQVTHGVNHSGNVLHWLGHGFEQHRMMTIAMIAGAMLVGLFAVQQFNLDNNFGLNRNLEHSDAFLLASELPPEAFADKGFDTWLVSKQD
jgi:hypothetical protein